ncbi:MAG: carboxypeptidase regulatory-like domain-containing protein [Acidobacteria bacterium]|nr:carboxypeptidase regulatory-like domain-containing protein [Acidobacteriota bacterium]
MIHGAAPRSKYGDTPAVTIGAQSGVSVDFVLMEDNRVGGRVVDPEGRPMKDVRVELVPTSGPANRRFIASNYSKDDGRFLIKDIPSGSYWLVANRDGERSGRRPFGAVYYPGVSTRKAAKLVSVSKGQHLEDMTIQIPKLDRTVQVSARVLFNDGEPVKEASLYVVHQNQRRSLNEQTGVDGFISFPLVAGEPTTLIAEWYVFDQEIGKRCPEYRQDPNDSRLMSLVSNNVTISAERDETGIVFTLPVRSCKPR